MVLSGLAALLVRLGFFLFGLTALQSFWWLGQWELVHIDSQLYHFFVLQRQSSHSD